MSRSREIEPASLVLIQAADPFKLRDLVQREQARRTLIPRSAVQEVRPGLWAVEVVQLRPIRRRWVRPVAVTAGAVTVLGGAAAAGWFLLSMTMTVVAGVGLGVVLTVAALLWLGYAALTSGGSGCETTVTIRHRH